MKPKIRWKSLSEVFLLLILCWGCEHDYFIEPAGFIATNSGTALEQARAWYASQGYNRTVWLYPETKAQNGILFYSEPSWKYYSETENQRYAAIDVALTDRIRLILSLKKTWIAIVKRAIIITGVRTPGWLY